MKKTLLWNPQTKSNALTRSACCSHFPFCPAKWSWILLTGQDNRSNTAFLELILGLQVCSLSLGEIAATPAHTTPPQLGWTQAWIFTSLMTFQRFNRAMRLLLPRKRLKEKIWLKEKRWKRATVVRAKARQVQVAHSRKHQWIWTAVWPQSSLAAVADSRKVDGKLKTGVADSKIMESKIKLARGGTAASTGASRGASRGALERASARDGRQLWAKDNEIRPLKITRFLCSPWPQRGPRWKPTKQQQRASAKMTTSHVRIARGPWQTLVL